MIKIKLRNRLRVFKTFQDYIKAFNKKPCCEAFEALYLVLSFTPTQVPPEPTPCYLGSINYQDFTSIDFRPLGGTIMSVDSDSALIVALANLGIVVTIQNCVITIVSGSSNNIVLPLIK